MSALPPLPTVPPRPEKPIQPSLNAIALRIKPADVQLWTEVQWLDGEGVWHTVEGWCAVLDLIAKGEGWKWWFFGEDLFGRGPFRWVVCDPTGTELLVSSDALTLRGGDRIVVSIFLPEE